MFSVWYVLCVLVTIVSDSGSLVPGRGAAEPTHGATVVADQFLWRLTLQVQT